MTLLTSVALLLVTFTPQNYASQTYNHSAHLDYAQEFQNVVVQSLVDNLTYTWTTYLNVTAHLYYNDEGDYRISNWYFEFTALLYSINGSQQYVYTDEDSSLVYAPDSWEFTQNQYSQELSQLTFRLFVDDDSTWNTTILYGENVVSSDYDIAGPSIYNNVDFKLTIDDSAFFNEIEHYVGASVMSDNGGASYQQGYQDGYYDASNQNGTAVTIFSGILNIGFLPINFFLAILDFQVFGIDIGGFVKGLLTIALVLIIIRFITKGGKLE